MKINLGCGNDKLRGYLNLDSSREVKPDKVWNLENTPLPFKTNSVSEIIGNHVLEHVNRFIPLMHELWRISENRAIIKIRSPHFASYSAWTDLTHKHPFGYMSFDYVAANKTHKHSVGKSLSHEYGEERFNVKIQKI